MNAKERGILDLLSVKSWAIKLATDAVRTVLAVDQIIVARQAGGECDLESMLNFTDMIFRPQTTCAKSKLGRGLIDSVLRGDWGGGLIIGIDTFGDHAWVE